MHKRSWLMTEFRNPEASVFLQIELERDSGGDSDRSAMLSKDSYRIKATIGNCYGDISPPSSYLQLIADHLHNVGSSYPKKGKSMHFSLGGA